ncbi:MAG TPA: cyclic nucleotide-binding domain-containing protein [Candidatus Ozemobacteraceae bacterium]|nr:cyclic nucleotide-binding domain-containing protein [Candidatus Ozemobacteraceae bacterium]
MFTFNYGKKLSLKAKTVIYAEHAPVSPNDETVFFIIQGKAMIARRTSEGFFRMGMAENMLMGLQDSFETSTRITSAITLEDSEIYSWKPKDFFKNISVDILLARAATFSLCRELRFLNEKRERRFSTGADETEGKFEVSEDMSTVGALYGLAFQKENEAIPDEIVAMFGKAFDAGETIIAENDLTDEIYILYDGRVEVSKGGTPICTMEAGEIFGEMSHFEKKPRAATIRAQIPSKTLKLEPKNFNVLYQLRPSWSVNLLKSLSRRITAAYSRM